ncbi:hypothetical protein GL50803_0015600 [Giardia duodenalis]|uniref:Uncharacterized protein n=1 Tax=Giardia intestinalis (strain ATCC 50803 / WB clone C6) TaxID=184922 RepID=A8BPV9_GIAIC|nr:hypothetical protein GL50803_0015600 [Giardia intestinalis]KAE8304339.1 hypothetical protein GL50803_0015600 [Giardia intestinalis]|eukprot:XP_001705684.1 Hypothetical protein GL50803_15600 [Giardia lamblia ATCC 50803]
MTDPIITIGPYLYMKLVKISTRVDSCLGMLLGKISADCIELCEVLGLNFNVEDPSLVKALKHAVDAQSTFYSHLTPVGIIFIGQEHHVPSDVVHDACAYFSLDRPVLAASYSPEDKEPFIVQADKRCKLKFVGTASDSAVVRAMFPELTRGVKLQEAPLPPAIPKELLSVLALTLRN